MRKNMWMRMVATMGLSLAVIGMGLQIDLPMFAFASGGASAERLNHLKISDTRAPMTVSHAWLQRGNDLSVLQQAYDFTPLYRLGYQGRGQTVAIVMTGVNQYEVKHDLDLFDQRYHLPPVDLQFVYPEGVKNADQSAGITAEPVIDVSMVHAFAPLAKIVCVVDSSSYESFQYIENQGTARIVNFSYGSPEVLDLLHHKDWLIGYDDILEHLAAHGVSVFVGSGDWGASDTDYHSRKPSWVDDPELKGKLTVNFPAADPWVTALGGTTLETNVDGDYTTEEAWPFSGGGYSNWFPRPAWQNGPGLPDDATHRAVPDASFDADAYTGLQVYFNNELHAVGGTSVAGPAWAAITALADEVNGKPLGLLNPALYRIANLPFYNEVFHDVTTGSNGYVSRAGWDADTGLGSPDVYRLVQALTVGVDHDIPPAPTQYELPTTTYSPTHKTTATR